MRPSLLPVPCQTLSEQVWPEPRGDGTWSGAGGAPALSLHVSLNGHPALCALGDNPV